MKKLLVLIGVFIGLNLHAQKANEDIMTGNDAYRKGDFDAAVNAYKSALKKDASNDIARFNLANALQRQSNATESQTYYDDIIQSTQLNSMKAASQYNKGIAYLKDKKLNEAITSFKNSLKLDPEDKDARENLQKALKEKDKQQQQQNQQQQNQKPPPQKDKKQPPPPKLNQKMMQQKFNELRNEEKQLQQKLQDKQSNTQQEKDW